MWCLKIQQDGCALKQGAGEMWAAALKCPSLSACSTFPSGAVPVCCWLPAPQDSLWSELEQGKRFLFILSLLFQKEDRINTRQQSFYLFSHCAMQRPLVINRGWPQLSREVGIKARWIIDCFSAFVGGSRRIKYCFNLGLICKDIFVKFRLFFPAVIWKSDINKVMASKSHNLVSIINLVDAQKGVWDTC